MKRSEMEHKVEEWFFTNEGTQARELSMLRNFLKFLETQGMLPPAYEKLVEAQGIASPSVDIKLYLKLPCNEWEPEND
jgi:hypothetical protein